MAGRGEMDEISGQGPSAKIEGRRAIFRTIACVLAFLVAAGLIWAWRAFRRQDVRESELTSPYRNTASGVHYVGDAACVRCHADIAEEFAEHPMGRSVTPIETATAEARGGGDASRDLFEAEGFRYSLERRGDRTFHRETRRDSEGRIIGDVEAEVKYVLGSGSRAFAYLLERDGYLFQSPVTWYSQKKRWDLAPGYAANNPHLERPITPACLFCHANRVEPVAGTLNQFRPPTFRGHSIGCERCHGPGELHVGEPTPPTGAGPNIVNPSKLEPALRESVCQQCHLLGEASVTERPGRELADFRPGLPLHRFETVFVSPESSRDHQNSGHVEQMHRSRCYTASGGKLGCISCHDPHRLPAAEEKVTYYRDRCLDCHADRGCSLPASTRLARSREDSCVECHMPRAATSDVPHVATTTHLIPRHRDRLRTPAARKPSRPDEDPLVPFHRDLMTAADLRQSRRDLGIVLQSRGGPGAAAALPLLDAAIAARPDDPQTRESRASALGALGRVADGLAEFEAALKLAPDREASLLGASLLAARLGRNDESIAWARRVIAVDPWRSDYHAVLGRELARGRRWREAVDECRRAVALNPANLAARLELIQAVLRAESASEARDEFEILLEYDPTNRESLTRWFNSLR
jgi:Tfp pilus assembly protein PilF